MFTILFLHTQSFLQKKDVYEAIGHFCVSFNSTFSHYNNTDGVKIGSGCWDHWQPPASYITKTDKLLSSTTLSISQCGKFRVTFI